MEQVLYVLQESLAAGMYAEKDPRVRKFIYTILSAEKTSMALINENRFLQTVLNSAMQGAVATLKITAQSVLVLHMIFHNLAMVKKAIKQKL